MMDKSILDKLLDRAPLVLLAIGATFIAMAAVGSWTRIGISVDDPVWRIVLGSSGIMLMSAAVFLIVRETKLIGPRLADCRKYEIKISSPQYNQQVNPPFNVAGHCKELPKGLELWVFAISGSGKGARYWPQNCAEIRDNSWSVQVYPGNWKPGDQRKYGVFLVGENGRALISYFKTAGQALPPGTPWAGITVLTDDIVQCGASVNAILAK